MREKVDFRLADYRGIEGTFDRIVSVGMFEHVGVGFYDAFFRKCASLLANDGVMVLSSTGRSDGPNVTCPWITKYIFPGGYIPALSEVLPAVERSGLFVTDIEILRLHYADNASCVAREIFGSSSNYGGLYAERFVRMLEFYLAGSEMAFRKQGMMVFQLQLAKSQNTVPMTRDYIEREAERLRVLEDQLHVPTRLAAE